MMCESNENTTLGTRSTQKLPSFIDPCKVTFGVPQVRDKGAAPLLNPDIRRIDVLKREQEDRKNYLLPYCRVFPGEQVKRNYNDHFVSDKRLGLATCVDETGGRVRRAMDWMSDKAEKMPIASERLTEHEKGPEYGPGENRTPSQMQAPADPALGLSTVAKARNVAEIMYGFTPKNLLGLTAPNGTPLHEDESAGHLCTTLSERARIIRAIIKKQLRDKKYKRGPEITAVLCDLAKGEKYISGAAADAVYDVFEPPLDDELRELLFDVVREESFHKESGEEANESKAINWALLASILDHNRIQPWEKSPQHYCMDEYPCLPQITESSEAVRLRVAKSIRTRTNLQKTTTQIHHGNHNVMNSGKLWRPLGLPNQQNNNNNVPLLSSTHGDLHNTNLPGAFSALCSGLSHEFDISKTDLLILRTKDDIKRIFKCSGVKRDIEEECEFERVWDLAREYDRKRMTNSRERPHSDLVTLDSFWRSLHHLNRKAIAAKITAKYNPCCTSKLFGVAGESPKPLTTQE